MNILRWCLFFPMAFTTLQLSNAAIAFCLSFVVMLISRSEQLSLTAGFVTAQVISAPLGVWVGSLVAPSHKFRVTAILSGLLIFLNFGLLLMSIFQKKRLFEQLDNRVMVVDCILVIVTLAAFCFFQFKAQGKQTIPSDEAP